VNSYLNNISGKDDGQVQKTMLRSIYLIHMITFQGKNKLIQFFLSVNIVRACKKMVCIKVRLLYVRVFVYT